MRHIAIAALTVALTGCASYDKRWSKPGASEAEFNITQAECQTQAFSATGNTPYPGSTAVLRQQAMIFTTCMRSKGWSLE